MEEEEDDERMEGSTEEGWSASAGSGDEDLGTSFEEAGDEDEADDPETRLQILSTLFQSKGALSPTGMEEEEDDERMEGSTEEGWSASAGSGDEELGASFEEAGDEDEADDPETRLQILSTLFQSKGALSPTGMEEEEDDERMEGSTEEGWSASAGSGDEDLGASFEEAGDEDEADDPETRLQILSTLFQSKGALSPTGMEEEEDDERMEGSTEEGWSASAGSGDEDLGASFEEAGDEDEADDPETRLQILSTLFQSKECEEDDERMEGSTEEGWSASAGSGDEDLGASFEEAGDEDEADDPETRLQILSTLFQSKECEEDDERMEGSTEEGWSASAGSGDEDLGASFEEAGDEDEADDPETRLQILSTLFQSKECEEDDERMEGSTEEGWSASAGSGDEDLGASFEEAGDEDEADDPETRLQILSTLFQSKECEEDDERMEGSTEEGWSASAGSGDEDLGASFEEAGDEDEADDPETRLQILSTLFQSKECEEDDERMEGSTEEGWSASAGSGDEDLGASFEEAGDEDEADDPETRLQILSTLFQSKECEEDDERMEGSTEEGWSASAGSGDGDLGASFEEAGDEDEADDPETRLQILSTLFQSKECEEDDERMEGSTEEGWSASAGSGDEDLGASFEEAGDEDEADDPETRLQILSTLFQSKECEEDDERMEGSTEEGWSASAGSGDEDLGASFEEAGDEDEADDPETRLQILSTLFQSKECEEDDERMEGSTEEGWSASAGSGDEDLGASFEEAGDEDEADDPETRLQILSTLFQSKECEEDDERMEGSTEEGWSASAGSGDEDLGASFEEAGDEDEADDPETRLQILSTLFQSKECEEDDERMEGSTEEGWSASAGSGDEDLGASFEEAGDEDEADDPETRLQILSTLFQSKECEEDDERMEGSTEEGWSASAGSGDEDLGASFEEAGDEDEADDPETRLQILSTLFQSKECEEDDERMEGSTEEGWSASAGSGDGDLGASFEEAGDEDEADDPETRLQILSTLFQSKECEEDDERMEGSTEEGWSASAGSGDEDLGASFEEAGDEDEADDPETRLQILSTLFQSKECEEDDERMEGSTEEGWSASAGSGDGDLGASFEEAGDEDEADDPETRLQILSTLFQSKECEEDDERMEGSTEEGWSASAGSGDEDLGASFEEAGDEDEADDPETRLQILSTLFQSKECEEDDERMEGSTEEGWSASAGSGDEDLGASFEEAGDEDEADDPETRLQILSTLFQSKDFIMEPGVLSALTEYFRLDGEPGFVIEQLSSNYIGSAQMCNVVGEWLVEAGLETEEVAGLFENSLSSLITKHFNSKKADAIFEQADNTGIEWLPHLIAHAPWRRLVYSLADTFPECLMLNFAVKLISDAGFQHEISSVTTAAQQLEIFSRVLTAALEAVLAQTPGTSAAEDAFQELVRVACVAEHTFLYTLALLHVLGTHASGPARGSVHRLAFRLRSAAAGHLPGLRLPEALGSGQDTSAVALALSLGPSPNPNVLTALFAMLSKAALNPADITLLYDYYRQPNPPPVTLLRQPEFLRLLIYAVFDPKVAKLDSKHKHKYTFLLSFATTMAEDPRKFAAQIRDEELDRTLDVVNIVSDLCQGKGDTAAELLSQLPQIFHHIRVPVVAGGFLHFIRARLSETNYFQLHPEPVPIHLALVDEIASQHPLLHSEVFDLLKGLMLGTLCASSSGDGEGEARAAGEVALERSRSFVDRLVHLLWNGFVVPVTQLMGRLYEEGTADTSLIRYFVTETLEVIGPPYSAALKEQLLPLVKSPDLISPALVNKNPALQTFLQHCT